MNKKSININKVNSDVKNVKSEPNKDINLYKNITMDVLNDDLSNRNIEYLKKMYESIKDAIDGYYLFYEKNNLNKEFIMKLQYIEMTVLYYLNLKTNEGINKKIKQLEYVSNTIRSQAKQVNRENKNIKQELKTIVSTIVAIVLAISVIPTAIAGIENINPNYILPFLSSVILFGVVMIAFIFSIYNIKFKKQTWAIIIIILILFVLSWCFSWGNDISSKNINDEVKIYNDNI